MGRWNPEAVDYQMSSKYGVTSKCSVRKTNLKYEEMSKLDILIFTFDTSSYLRVDSNKSWFLLKVPISR